MARYPLPRLAALAASILLLILGVIRVSAQRYWPGVVDTVRVSAPRPTLEERLLERPGFATVVPLGTQAPADRDLGDLLDRTAGTHIHRYGGAGSYSTASVRGSSPSQVTVCLDGVPLAAAADGTVNLALFPVQLLDRAEIYRGPQAATFGGPPAAGVINLVTPSAGDVPVRLSAGAGAYGLRSAQGQWGGTLEGTRLLLAGQHRRSRGDFRYLDDNGTPLNAADDRTRERANNDFNETHLLWKASRNLLGSLVAGYTGQHLHRHAGIAGHKNRSTEEVRFQTDLFRHQTTFRWRPGAGWEPTTDLSLHLTRRTDRLHNPEGEAGLSRVVSRDRTHAEGLRMAAGFRRAPLFQELQLVLEGRGERWTPHNELTGATGFTRSRRHRTIAVENRWRRGRILVDLAYRWARTSDNYGGPVVWGRPPRPAPERRMRHEGWVGGLSLRLGRGLGLKLSQGEMIRFPTLGELFGAAGAQDGNPQLRPETGTQWDAGLTYSPDAALRVESAYFERLVEDQIYLLQNSQRTLKAANVDRAWTRGIETSIYGNLELPARARLELILNHTWQEALDVGPSRTYRGKRIPNLPRNEGYASLQLRRAAWGLRWETSARSMSFWHRYNRTEQKTPAYAVHDLTLERSFRRERWKLRFTLHNVSDQRVEDIDGYPLPGRHIFAEVAWSH
ncbi:MAG: TonB-dependent receptor [Candidatus Eisenbacteria bacterium]|nr:TonB-dependent receptor [Candidatus Eisenbacteria bacterium]